jgi:benzoylformate decarboxylase
MLAGDLVGLAQSVTKSAIEVTRAEDLPLVLRRAFAEARRPPAGPVFVSIPMDLLEEDVEVRVPRRSFLSPLPAASGLGEATRLLTAARHPVIIAGDGVGREGAVAHLVSLAEALGAAVFHQPMADGINFPGNHPLYQGMILPTTAAIRTALAPYDMVVIVGTQAFMAHHYTPEEPIGEGVAVVQIDSDPAELGRNFPVDCGLLGGIGSTVAELARRLGGRVRGGARRMRTLTEDATERQADLDRSALGRYGPAPMDPLAAVHAIASSLPPDTVVVEEAITAGLLLRQVLRQDEPGSYVHTVGGALGWGIGAAIGIRMGVAHRPVAAVLGDGCATFGLQGLWSAAHYGTPVAFFVFNNGEYRTLKDTLDRHGSRSTARKRYLGLDLREPALDWQAAAGAFGVSWVRATGCTDLAGLAASVSTLESPLLIEVPVTPHP